MTNAQENMVKSTSNSVANFCSGACGAYNKTIAIVNQLAEEYQNDISQEQYRNGYADGWHDCASTIQQSAPYQPKGE